MTGICVVFLKCYVHPLNCYILQGILQYVNKQLHLAQNKQRLLEHQSKLDTSALERTSHPIAQQFKVTYRTCTCTYTYENKQSVVYDSVHCHWGGSN